MTTEILPDEIRKDAEWSAFMGLMTAIIGLFTVIYAVGQSAVSPYFLGWMLLLAAIAQFILAYNSQVAGHFIAKIVMAASYAVAGVAVAVFVPRQMVELASVVGVLLVFESMLEMIVTIGLTPIIHGRLSIEFSALGTVLLGTYVLGQGPTCPNWIAAMLLGVAILINGCSRFAAASSIRSDT